MWGGGQDKLLLPHRLALKYHEGDKRYVGNCLHGVHSSSNEWGNILLPTTHTHAHMNVHMQTHNRPELATWPPRIQGVSQQEAPRPVISTYVGG